MKLQLTSRIKIGSSSSNIVRLIDETCLQGVPQVFNYSVEYIEIELR